MFEHADLSRRHRRPPALLHSGSSLDGRSLSVFWLGLIQACRKPCRQTSADPVYSRKIWISRISRTSDAGPPKNTARADLRGRPAKDAGNRRRIKNLSRPGAEARGCSDQFPARGQRVALRRIGAVYQRPVKRSLDAVRPGALPTAHCPRRRFKTFENWAEPANPVANSFSVSETADASKGRQATCKTGKSLSPSESIPERSTAHGSTAWH